MNKDELFKIQSNTLYVKTGDVLLSEPFLNDFYFSRSVILLIDHHEEEGSLGVIINKRLSIAFNDIVEGFPHFEADVYLGGPVATDRIFFIHTIGNLIPDSHEIIKGIFWSGNISALKSMIRYDLIKPYEIRFYVGYAGWDKGQLKQELKHNSWLVSNATSKDILMTNPREMWNTFVNNMGKRYKLWKSFPINPTDN